jgi:hypothetical protein
MNLDVNLPGSLGAAMTTGIGIRASAGMPDDDVVPCIGALSVAILYK